MNKFSGADSGGDFNIDHNDDRDGVWTERLGQDILLKTEQQIDRFLLLYKKFKQVTDRMDTVARYMNWALDEWQEPEVLQIEKDQPEYEEAEKDLSDEQIEPYLFYHYPQYIVAKGLIKYYNQLCFGLPFGENVVKVFDTCATIHSHIDLAFASFDLCEDVMVICHLKQILTEVNRLMEIMEISYFSSHKVSIEAQKEYKSVLFDMRELALRFLQGAQVQRELLDDEED